MSTYLVRLKGQNFVMDGGEGPRKKRCYVTGLVEAENPKRAELSPATWLSPTVGSKTRY